MTGTARDNLSDVPVASNVESPMRWKYERGIRASQLLEKYAEPSTKPWHEPDETTIKPPVLTRTQEIALLTLRHSDQGNQVLRVLFARGHTRPVATDYASLVPVGLAQRDGSGLHSISPRGQYRAGLVTHDIARELGITLLTYSGARRRGYSRMPAMSDFWNG